MSIIVNVHEAKTHLSRLLEQAHAGQEIILAKAEKRYARLMPLAPERSRRRPGRLAGRADDAFFEHLPVSHFHGIRAGGYAVEHRDPFDRMLAAQSELECLPLVSCDPAFALFGTRTLW